MDVHVAHVIIDRQIASERYLELARMLPPDGLRRPSPRRTINCTCGTAAPAPRSRT
ncbi:MAG: hypothetical protein ACE5JZ_04365 [Kiloniellales bacterium]